MSEIKIKIAIANNSEFIYLKKIQKKKKIHFLKIPFFSE